MTISQHTVTGQDVDLDQLIAEYAQIVPPLNEAQASVAVRVWQLLAKGAPVTFHAPTEDLGVPAQQVEAALDGAPAGRYLKDHQGGIIAFWGMSLLKQSQHRMLIGEQTLFAWCAGCAVPAPGARRNRYGPVRHRNHRAAGHARRSAGRRGARLGRRRCRVPRARPRQEPRRRARLTPAHLLPPPAFLSLQASRRPLGTRARTRRHRRAHPEKTIRVGRHMWDAMLQLSLLS